jgi:hypothetical protein
LFSADFPSGERMANRRQSTASERVHPHSRLRRIVSAFRERDWPGILIELLVVTLGVLLAFQIDQWGQDRRQARDERQFLERMWRETNQAIRENDWVISLHARNRKGLIQGLSARGDGRALAKFAVAPMSGCGADSMPGLGFNDTSYQELSASGRLNILSDPELRSVLRDVAAAQADAVAQLNYSRQKSIPIRESLEKYYRFGLDPLGNHTCTTNWPGLVNDPIATNAIVRAARNHLLMWWKRAYTRDVLAKAHNRIACKLRKPDCADRVPQIVGRRNYSDTLPPDLVRTFDDTAARDITPSRDITP